MNAADKLDFGPRVTHTARETLRKRLAEMRHAFPYGGHLCLAECAQPARGLKVRVIGAGATNMQAIIWTSYAIAFALELALCAVAGMWGFALAGGGLLGWTCALVGIAVVIGLWFPFASPKAPFRLQMPWLLIFKIVLFGIGTVVLWRVLGQPVWAAWFGGLAAAHLGIAAATGTV